MLQGIDFSGSLPLWGTFITVLTTALGLLGVWIKGIPERRRAETEDKGLTGQQYAAQIADFRKEVHGYRNELHIIQRDLEKSESRARQRADRIVALTVVVKLVMSEIKRLDPKSSILAQAEELLTQLVEEDKPETAAQAARQTLEAAERTVAKVEGTV
jgi:hypothetical protein